MFPCFPARPCPTRENRRRAGRLGAGIRDAPVLKRPVFLPLLASSLLLASSFGACGRGAPTPSRPVLGADGAHVFHAAEREAGLDFTYRNGMTGALYMVEMMGSGAALFDFDRDGDLDLYLPQGRPLGPGGQAAEKPGGRLYCNRLVDGGRSGRLAFDDCTEASGIRALEYGLGAAVGDVDGDGFEDLYLSDFGPNQLWRNRGDGTFEEVPGAGGAQDERWSASASFFDADGDGDLDLFLANYVDFSLANTHGCSSPTGRPDYCSPNSYRGEPDRFFRNRGDGTFEDATVESGIAAAYANGLGTVAVDFDQDGWLDVYVANDLSDNILWLNQHDGTFRNEAVLAGVAVNSEGHAEAGMGVIAADLDDDGDQDIFLTHLVGETNTLYVNQGGGLFLDQTRARGLAMPSIGRTGFGVVAPDVDNDGRLDLVVGNGAVTVVEALALAGDPYPLSMPNQLFLQQPDGTFRDASERLVADLPDEVTRGLAMGDVDNDGDSDVVVVNNSQPARLLRNDVGSHNRWLGLDLRMSERAAPSAAVGAQVTVHLRGGAARHRRVSIDGSYLASNDPRILVGLGAGDEVERVEVRWPYGETEAWSGLEPGRYHRLVRGSGNRSGSAPSTGANSTPRG